MYSIGKVANMAGISTHTIRAWEKRYNLDLAMKDQAGNRTFSRLCAEQISLLAKLTSEGFKISDIVALSLDELNLLAVENQLKQVTVNQPVVYVKGERLSRIVTEHALLFSGYVIQVISDQQGHVSMNSQEPQSPRSPMETPDLMLWEWGASSSEDLMAELMHFQAQFPNVDIHVFYTFGARKVITPLESAGIHFVKSSPSRELVFDILQENSKKQRLHLVAMEKAEERLASFRSRPQPMFDTETLERYLHDLPKLECECPNHLSEIVLKLHDFQTYTNTCLEGEQNDARLHHIIHDYTSFARNLMEQALTLVLQAEGVIPINDQMDLLKER